MPKVESIKEYIDVRKLEKIIETSGKTKKVLSYEIGRGHDHVARILRNGYISKTDLLALCSILGIQKEMIVIEKEKSYINVDSEVYENESIRNELTGIEQYLKDIADSLKTMTTLYERAWIDKE